MHRLDRNRIGDLETGRVRWRHVNDVEAFPDPETIRTGAVALAINGRIKGDASGHILHAFPWLARGYDTFECQ